MFSLFFRAENNYDIQEDSSHIVRQDDEELDSSVIQDSDLASLFFSTERRARRNEVRTKLTLRPPLLSLFFVNLPSRSFFFTPPLSYPPRVVEFTRKMTKRVSPCVPPTRGVAGYRSLKVPSLGIKSFILERIKR